MDHRRSRLRYCAPAAMRACAGRTAPAGLGILKVQAATSATLTTGTGGCRSPRSKPTRRSPPSRGGCELVCSAATACACASTTAKPRAAAAARQAALRRQRCRLRRTGRWPDPRFQPDVEARRGRRAALAPAIGGHDGAVRRTRRDLGHPLARRAGRFRRFGAGRGQPRRYRGAGRRRRAPALCAGWRWRCC